MRQGKLTESALDQAWRAYAAALEADYTTVLDRVLVMHGGGLLTEPIIVTKHLPGRHDQKLHDPYKGKGGPVGLKPDLERQARWQAMMDDPEMSEYHANKAIQEEIAALEGGPEALRELDKWYYNPGDPDQAILDPIAESKWEYEMDQLDDPDDFVQFEDWVYDEAQEMGWNPADDHALLRTLEAVKTGDATPQQVEAMSAIYDSTQAYLKSKGISEVKVTRGLALDPEDAAQLKKGRKIGTSLTGHWSADQDVSEKFAAKYYDRTPVEYRPETKEVVVHRTFPADQVFDHYMAWGNKTDEHAQQVYMNEKEIVPVDGTEHKITKMEPKKSRYGGLETMHVWVK